MQHDATERRLGAAPLPRAAEVSVPPLVVFTCRTRVHVDCV